MGGDDLGSDDEFLTAPIRDLDDASATSEKEKEPVEIIVKPKVEKRNAPRDESSEVAQVSASKKRKKGGGNSLRDLGTGVRAAPSETQAKLLSEFSGVRILPHQVARFKDDDDDSSESELGIAKRVQGIVSKKKLKKWKIKESPCVLIICLSARRAVHVLKELAPLNVRAAKLFAKHITIEDQVKQLQESPFGIAVGTPHRILTLAQQGALSLEQTQCVVLDTFLNDKKYSVYTLPDTVPHTQDFLKEYAHPELLKRRDLNIAFV